MAAEDRALTLKDALLAEPQVMRLLPARELDAILEPRNYIGSAETIVKNVVAEVKGRT